MFARIYRPAKTATQSGKANTDWRLEFESRAPRAQEPLMGWTSASDMDADQVALDFDTKDDAIAYAERRGVAYQVFEARPGVASAKAYSDNFAFRRRTPWTH